MSERWRIAPAKQHISGCCPYGKAAPIERARRLSLLSMCILEAGHEGGHDGYWD